MASLRTGLILTLGLAHSSLAVAGVDQLTVPSIRGFPGEAGIVHPIRASNTAPVQGYQIAAAFDSTVIELEDVTLEQTITIGLDPEFMVANLELSGPDSFFTFAVILETASPFDGTIITPGTDRIFANLVYGIPATVPIGTETSIDLRDDVAEPPIFNIFTVAGLSVLPRLVDGIVTIVPPQMTFLRADANSDDLIDLRDVMFLLEFLFLNGSAPECPDAADFNDDGSINLNDPVSTLPYLFTDGPPPAYPFPGFGLDPTDDNLGICGP